MDNGTLFDCFVLSEEPMTFKDAVVYCGNQGIPLAEIQTELDHSNIIEKLQVCCNNYRGPKPLPAHVTCWDNVKNHYMIRLNNNLVYGV